MKFEDKKNILAEYIFLAGTVLYIMYYFLYIAYYWYVEKNPVYQMPIQRLFYVGVICFIIKIILTKYQWKEILVLTFGVIIMYLCWKTSGGIDYPVNFLIIFACKDVNLRKTMKAIFCTATMVLIYGFTWFFINAPDMLTRIKNYGRGMVEVRYKFCTWHANTIHLMILILIISFLYVFYRECKWWMFLILAFFNYEFFQLTKSRTAFYCGMFAILAYFILRYARDIFRFKITLIVIELGNIVGIIMSVYYGMMCDVTNPRYMMIDRLITGRLTVARNCLMEAGIPLFGSNIGGKVCGYGIYTQQNPGYVTELGIVRTLLEYGPIVFGIFCIMILVAAWILHKKGYYGALILLETGFIVCGVEAYFPAAYNLKAFMFGLAFYQFMQLFNNKKCQKRREVNGASR